MKRVLITGAAGYVGSLLGQRLAGDMSVLGTDIRVPHDPPFEIYRQDIRDPALAELMRDEGITHVVHLASVLQASRDPALDFDIDVGGTRNVLQACLRAHVQHLTVTSSGAAYGYHADNPPWIDEDEPLRGHPAFAYAEHKRQIEELLADYRGRHPRLMQLVLRPGTILGEHTRNQITRLFLGKRVLAVRGSASPFVFIWDEDVTGAIEHGLRHDRTGAYNLAGDGAMTIHEIAAMLGKPVRTLPARVIVAGLWIGQRLGLTVHGPEQIDFLRYRPVLCNRRLKDVFGYVPRKTSAETFALFVAAARAAGDL